MVLLCLNRAYFVNIGRIIQCPLLRRAPKYLKHKHYTKQAANIEKYDHFLPFMDMIKLRRDEASRSILIQVHSTQSYKQLFSYCDSIGKIDNMFHYCEGPEPMHFVLIEFATDSDVKNILASSTHIQENQTVPATSHFLWFRAANKKLSKLKHDRHGHLSIENGTAIVSESSLNSALSSCGTISEQITELYKLTRLNDLGMRLRFLTAKQIESTISGIFPEVCAFPFGSSVNGFGKMGCDLDIVLRLLQEKEKPISRLIYHCKAASGSERSMSQRNMETVGDLINLFLPGCSQVRRILQARVPIIKYHQQLTNVDCDLSMTNMSGVYMSDFLYLMGEFDPRVRPLIFTIRKWAKEVHLTNSSPGRWISNFSLTLLALAFLQKPLQSPPVLPTLNQLVKNAGPNDKHVTEEGIDGTFLRDIRKLPFKTENDSSLESLLKEFFEFYSQFDFANKAVCLNEAVSITKPEYSPMYIVNPLERGLNVTKNMSSEEVERFKVEVRNAAWILESKEHKLDFKGLLSIFQAKDDLKHRVNLTFSQQNNRLMDVSTLFNEETGNTESEQIVYKNEAVQKQVEGIKKETQSSIKSLEMKPKKRKSGR